MNIHIVLLIAMKFSKSFSRSFPTLYYRLETTYLRLLCQRLQMFQLHHSYIVVILLRVGRSFIGIYFFFSCKLVKMIKRDTSKYLKHLKCLSLVYTHTYTIITYTHTHPYKRSSFVVAKKSVAMTTICVTHGRHLWHARRRGRTNKLFKRAGKMDVSNIMVLMCGVFFYLFFLLFVQNIENISPPGRNKYHGVEWRFI